MVRRSTVLLVMLSWVLAAAPAWADFRLERRLALAPGGSFTLDTQVGSVDLVGDSTSGVTVTITSTRDDLDDRLTFDFEEQPGRVRVTAKRTRGISDWFFEWRQFGRVRFTVHVPSRTDVSVSTSGGELHLSRLEGPARLRTSGGRVRVEDVVGDVNANTSGGSIRVERVRGSVDVGTSGGAIEVATIAGPVRAGTSGGAITIEATSGDVAAETSGGRIQVRGAGGHVRAHTSGGPVMVNFAPGNSRGGDLSTSGGGVTAAVDPRAALTIDASTSGGGVSTDLALTTRNFSRNSVRGDLNGGGPALRLRTSGGPIQIAAAETR
jgi:DUF4097 and DUF4098 domain-containing protein YvlB